MKLLQDTTGVVIRSLEEEYPYQVHQITLNILQQWIEGKGRQPVTWATLTDVLDECNLHALSNTIRSEHTEGK